MYTINHSNHLATVYKYLIESIYNGKVTSITHEYALIRDTHSIHNYKQQDAKLIFKILKLVHVCTINSDSKVYTKYQHDHNPAVHKLCEKYGSLTIMPLYTVYMTCYTH